MARIEIEAMTLVEAHEKMCRDAELKPSGPFLMENETGRVRLVGGVLEREYVGCDGPLAPIVRFWKS